MEDEKKRRNRLAQRKHRAKTASGSTTSESSAEQTCRARNPAPPLPLPAVWSTPAQTPSSTQSDGINFGAMYSASEALTFLGTNTFSTPIQSQMTQTSVDANDTEFDWTRDLDLGNPPPASFGAVDIAGTSASTTHVPHASCAADANQNAIISAMINNGPDGSSTTTLEDQVAHVLAAMSDTSFNSVDELVQTFYTEGFRPGTLAYWAQTASRTRRSLAPIAEDYYTRELRDYCTEHANSEYADNARKRVARRGNSVRRPGDKDPATTIDCAIERERISEALRQICLEEVPEAQLKHDKMYLREQVPDTWSLLTGLAMSADVPEPKRSHAVCIFLRLLGLPIRAA